MVMVAHQHPRVHPPTGPFTRLSQGLVKQEPIGFIAENALSSIPTRHHVVKATPYSIRTTRATAHFFIDAVRLSRFVD
jgi:hypothetical protein